MDGTITNVMNPTVTFEVSDTGAGISTTNPATDITLAINGVTVSGWRISYQAIANGFRAIFAQGTSWLQTEANGGFNVVDGVEFSLKIVAVDKAGNQAATTSRLTITTSTPAR